MRRKIWVVLGLALLVSAACGEKKVQPLKESPAQAAPAVSAAPAETPAAALPAKVELPADPNSPLRVIERYTDELRTMVGLNERKQKGMKDEAREKQVQSKVREFFDFPTLARMSLGAHWKKITPAQQKEYSELFIKLVEDSYIRRSRDLVGNYQLSFTGEEITGDRSKVTCRVARKDADIDILYELHRKDGRWMIFNIVLDNVDLIKNYQSQFNQIIKQRGWDHLIKLMQAKLDNGGEAETDL
jgi:phospholipid transport system substrate-binding protein